MSTRFEATWLRLPGAARSVPVIIDRAASRFVRFQTATWNDELAADFASTPGLVTTYDWRDLPPDSVETSGEGVVPGD